MGNLCRHSDKFYSSLSAPVRGPSYNHSPARSPASGRDGEGTVTVLSFIVKCCSDKDPATAKFACFAVGNSAFHSSALYPLLASSIRPLMLALSNEDEKTRANAAGAIGNLVRNGNQLCKAIVESGAVKRLILVVRDDPAISPQRIALFSLGTLGKIGFINTHDILYHSILNATQIRLASHTICRADMGVCKPSASELLRSLSSKVKEGTGSGDEALMKYAARLKTKLKQSAPPGVAVGTGGSTQRPLSGEIRLASR